MNILLFKFNHFNRTSLIKHAILQRCSCGTSTLDYSTQNALQWGGSECRIRGVKQSSEHGILENLKRFSFLLFKFETVKC